MSVIIFPCIALLLISMPVFINVYLKVSTRRRIFKSIHTVQNARVALLLGAKVFDNNEVSQEVYDRIMKTAELYNSGKIDKVIISGDHGTKEYDEVNTIRSWMLKFPISEDDIFMDHAGFSTYESIYRAKEIFGVKSMIIVTQKFHLPRAVFIAGKMGISCQGFIADRKNYKLETSDTIREFLARAKDFIYALILKPKPAYLGEKISLNGSGLITRD
ncbi:MAG: YdcF family protein [Spirochaetales bacterium]|nr:YdcF family protein [Spirochaetales bacterium]